jgi:hypothetical protein
MGQVILFISVLITIYNLTIPGSCCPGKNEKRELKKKEKTILMMRPDSERKRENYF